MKRAFAVTVLLSTIMTSSGLAQALHRDDNIFVTYMDDATTLSQTLMAGVRSSDGSAVLTLTCNAENHLMGGVMINGAGAADLGNAVQLEAGEKTLTLRGRGWGLAGRLQFDPTFGAVFLSDIDHLRMVKPANMRFINFVYDHDTVTATMPTGTDNTIHTFVLTDFRPWMERVADECDRELGS